jgi:hypothetical protein
MAEGDGYPDGEPGEGYPEALTITPAELAEQIGDHRLHLEADVSVGYLLLKCTCGWWDNLGYTTTPETAWAAEQNHRREAGAPAQEAPNVHRGDQPLHRNTDRPG